MLSCYDQHFFLTYCEFALRLICKYLSLHFELIASYFYWLLNTVIPVRQEQELRNGGTVDKKLSTLADLFRPPIELMHKGSFETVMSHSLVNLTLYSLIL